MITSELFSEAMGELDPKYLDEMLGYTPKTAAKKKPKTFVVKYVALAAVLCLVVAAAVWANWDSGLSVDENTFPIGTEYEDDTVESTDLPMLTISLGSDGMGFESYTSLEEINRIISENPWSEDMEIPTLPVYKNQISYTDKHHVATGTDLDKMTELLLEIAGRFGLDTGSLEITDNAATEEEIQRTTDRWGLTGDDDPIPDGYFDATEVSAEADGVTITVDLHLSATARLEDGIYLPEEYADPETYEDYVAVAEYFIAEYSELLDMEDPQFYIRDYGYYAVYFYDAAGTDIEDITRYNFNTVMTTFSNYIDFENPDLSGKVGDYPIITVEEATEMLTSGRYLSSAPVEFPGEEYVVGVELIYRTGNNEEYFLPYYRFYVEIDFAGTTYAAYYVPAISEKYISDLTVWDGRFN